MSDQPTTPGATAVAPTATAAPGGPSGPGGAFPAPAVPVWGQGAAPITGNKRKPGVIIGAAASGVFVLGGALGLVNLTKHDTKPATAPISVGPTINPNNGPAPAPVAPKPPTPVPGPTPAPVVSTTTLPPTPSTTPPSTPSTGKTQTVSGSISVAVPSGWSVDYADEGDVALITDGAQFSVEIYQKPGNAQQLMAAYLDSVAGISGVEDMTVTGGGDHKLPSSKFVSAYEAQYEGVLATQQGSVPVEADVITYVTADGVGIVVEAFNEKGQFSHYSSAYSTMLTSVVRSV